MPPIFEDLSRITPPRKTTKRKRQHKRQNSGENPKTPPFDGTILDDRLLLEELGFLAGQHEMIDTAYSKDAVEEVRKRVKEVKKEIDANKKEFKDIENQINKSYQRMEFATNRYMEAHNLSESASDAFERAQSSGDVTKNEIERAKQLMEVRAQACQKAKSEYASQIKDSNEEQRNHYTEHLPGLISKGDF